MMSFRWLNIYDSLKGVKLYATVCTYQKYLCTNNRNWCTFVHTINCDYENDQTGYIDVDDRCRRQFVWITSLTYKLHGDLSYIVNYNFWNQIMVSNFTQDFSFDLSIWQMPQSWISILLSISRKMKVSINFPHRITLRSAQARAPVANMFSWFLIDMSHLFSRKSGARTAII